MTLLVDELGGMASDEAATATGILTVLALYVSSFIGSLLAITLGAGSVAPSSTPAGGGRALDR